MDLILWRHADAENSRPDAARKLTERGCRQARRVASWLKPRLPAGCKILSSPAERAQQTAAALGIPFETLAALGTDTNAIDALAAADWPGPGSVVIVGHQPTLGRIAAFLLSGRESDWSIAKGALWWLQDNYGEINLRAALDPELIQPTPERECPNSGLSEDS